jgi:hypothetical protein
MATASRGDRPTSAPAPDRTRLPSRRPGRRARVLSAGRAAVLPLHRGVLLLLIVVVAVEAFRATDPVTFEEHWSTDFIVAITRRCVPAGLRRQPPALVDHGDGRRRPRPGAGRGGARFPGHPAASLRADRRGGARQLRRRSTGLRLPGHDRQRRCGHCVAHRHVGARRVLALLIGRSGAGLPVLPHPR